MLPQAARLGCLLFVLTFTLFGVIVCHETISTSNITATTNEVIRVDLRAHDNSVRHHTNQYRLNPSLVLRRSDAFNMSLQLRDIYNATIDRLRLELSLSSIPGAQPIYLPISRESRYLAVEPTKWSLRLVNDKDDKLYMTVFIPSNAPIGIWRLKFSVKLAGGKELRSFSVRESIYLIFNPWSKDDTVYLPRDDARQEYVLTEMGKIYQGTYAATTGKTWNYGQFSEYVLPGMMMLLDKARLDAAARSDVVKISRAISGLMNSNDDNGLMVGNWSSSYRDGISPWEWTGSATIFERYLRSGGRPVKFGQCWVFGGLTTTALRTLGIPARTISNFFSAHDTDLTLTHDQFSSERGDKIGGVNTDSIWNFHCWSDAWMVREDLPPRYSGWQAIDATPQEMSNGTYQLGPASVEAIKQGKTDYGYDVAFVYSEVNSDVVTWVPDRRKPFGWRRAGTQTNHVGKKILTKRIGSITSYGVSDAEDITDQYKHREGSKEEREAFNEAYKAAKNEQILANTRYKHEYESNPLCTTAVLFCLTIVFLTTFILPIDIFLVSFIKNTDGHLKDWATPELLEKIDKGVLAAYYALYGICIFLIFVVIPFLHFFNEETESNSQDRLHNATKYTFGFALVAVVLIAFGILIPLPAPDAGSIIDNIIHITKSTNFQRAINLILAVITVSGIINVSFYTASGIFTWPIGLIVGTRSVASSLSNLNDREVVLRLRVNALREQGRSGLSASDREQLIEAENELRQLEIDSIALSGYSETWTYKLRKAIRPTQIGAGILLVAGSVGLLGSLVVANLDRILHGAGPKQGYILTKPTIFNPLEYLFMQVQSHLEFGPLILLFLTFYLVIATISGIRNLGLWFLFARIHRVKVGRTQPQALLFFCITLMLAVVALNNFLYSLAPEFVSFGAQSFNLNGTVTACSLDNYVSSNSNCVLTRSSQLSMRVSSQVWIFGSILYWANWIFVGLSGIAFLSCLIRGKRTATHGIVNNDDDFED